MNTKELLVIGLAATTAYLLFAKKAEAMEKFDFYNNPGGMTPGGGQTEFFALGPSAAETVDYINKTPNLEPTGKATSGVYQVVIDGKTYTAKEQVLAGRKGTYVIAARSADRDSSGRTAMDRQIASNKAKNLKRAVPYTRASYAAKYYNR